MRLRPVLLFIFFLSLLGFAFAQENNILFSNFTAGSLTRKLDARIDFEKYFNGARTIENAFVYPYGGVVKRPGTYYVSGVSDHSKSVRLIPFTFSTEQSYVIEMGDQHARFYMNHGLIQSSSVSEVDDFTKLLLHYDGEDSSEVFEDSSGSNHTMVGYRAKLSTMEKKFGTASVAVSAFTGNISTADSDDFYFASNVFTVDTWVRFANLGVSTVAKILYQETDANNYSKLTFTAGSSSLEFEYSLVVASSEVLNLSYSGSENSYNKWYHVALIRGWGGNTNSWALCLNGIAVDTETYGGTYPNFTGSFYPAGAVFYGYEDEYRVSKGIARWTANFATPDAPYPLLYGFAGGEEGGVGIYSISTPYIEGDLDKLQYVQSADYLYFVHEDYAPWALTRTGHAAWSGSYMALSGVTFGGTTGYPRTIEFHEERLCFGGTTVYPQTIWMSKSGDYNDFTSGATDDYGIVVTLSASQVNAIQWMNSGNVLTIGTSGGEWIMGSSNQTEPITPSNIQLKRQTNYGSEYIQAERIGESVFFIQRGGKKIRDFHYDYNADSHVSPDITLLSEHLTSGTTKIKHLMFQRGDIPLLWVLQNNGDLLACTYMPDQKVNAWSKITTNGNVESIAIIPNSDNNDELWLSVARTDQDSGTSRFVEYMKEIEQDDNDNAYYVDCGLSLSGIEFDTEASISHIGQTAPAQVTISAGNPFYNNDIILITSVSGMTDVNDRYFTVSNSEEYTFRLVDEDSSTYSAYVSGGTAYLYSRPYSGVTHLSGLSVQILADGVYLGEETVDSSGDTVYINGGAVRAHVGLGYNTTLETMNVPAAFGNLIRITDVVPRIYQTSQLKYGVDTDSLNTYDFTLSGTTPFTGDIDLRFPSGFKRDQTIVLYSDEPLPFSVSGILIRYE